MEKKVVGGIYIRGNPHLSRVEFVLAHDLDGDLLARLAVDRLVDVGKGAVAHLFD